MMTTETQSPVQTRLKDLTYGYLDIIDVHEVVISGSSRQMMDDFFKVITEIYYSAPTGSTRHVLIVQTGPSIPMTYFMNGVRSFISEHRKRARPVPARFAIVLEKTPILQLISQMLKLMRHQDLVAFFNADERENAILWLTEE